MNSMELLTGPLAQAIGWALLHLLWQATIVAGILAAVLALMTRASANTRYTVSCSALALVFAMFVGTAIRAYDPAAEPIVVASETAPAPDTIKVPLTQLPVLIAESAAEGLRDRAIAAAASARTKLPLIVAIWLAGVVLLSARLLVSWMRARRLITHGARPASREWMRVAEHLSEALGLRRAITLLESAAVEVPSVIGSLRPIILLPASALTGMTPEQIEMVLAHEMAHIRRHDFLVNLLQAVVETLMFYHPGVWWMSRRVRIERENCCDDLAVAVCGNPIQYARALTRLEELRANALPVVVAANGGSLLERIRRIAAGRAEGTTSSSRWAAAVAMLVILAFAAAVPSLPALADREEKKAAKDNPKKSEAKVDVVEAREPADEVAVHPDIDVDPDIDIDVDYDYDYDYDVETPEPPDVPMIAPVAIPSITPRPAIAPLAPIAIGVPTPMPTPRAPVAIAAGFGDHDFDFEFEHDTDETKDREIGANGKLTVDELISLRASGVTPAYVTKMRGYFPGLTLRQVTSLGALGVDDDFIKEMRDAGFELKTVRDATSLKAVGVTPEYIKQMRSAGFEVKNARDASSLKAVGVSPEWVRAMRAAGYEIKTARDASSLKAVGVDPEFVGEMRNLGFDVKNVRDLSSLAALGVNGAWLREMRAAGVKIDNARDATTLKAVGVTAEFVKKLAAAGYDNLSVRELSRLAAAGVDDDFIREMDQYRKKN